MMFAILAGAAIFLYYTGVESTPTYKSIEQYATEAKFGLQLTLSLILTCAAISPQLRKMVRLAPVSPGLLLFLGVANVLAALIFWHFGMI